MATVSPFRAWRFNQDVVGDMASVLCPPYDMITPETQESLKRLNQYNVIHLEAGESLDWDAAGGDQYRETADLFERWMGEGVLRQDPEPGYYLLRHRFPLGGKDMTRLGLIACVGLEDYQKRQVLPHEYTEAPAIRDRVALMESLRANISPIMSLYRDAQGELAPVFEKVMAGGPEVDATDGTGSTTTLWRIADPGAQAAIARFFATRPVYLADGHHRYEAARQYQLDRHAENAAGADLALSQNSVMMTLIAFDDPGLVVLPYHRTLSGVAEGQLREIQDRLEELFQHEAAGTSSADELVGKVAHLGRDRRLLASVGPGDAGARLLTLRESAQASDWGPLAVSEAWVLEEQVLRPVLGDATLEHLGYSHDHEEALAGVASGALQMAFLLKPFPLGAFEDIVGDGQRLPRKSTFFYPKLPTGLVINSLEGRL